MRMHWRDTQDINSGFGDGFSMRKRKTGVSRMVPKFHDWLRYHSLWQRTQEQEHVCWE